MPRNIPPFEPPARRVVSDPPSAFPENFQRLQYYSDRRHAWTHIVSGQSSKSPYSGLLFYEQGIGYSEFYDTDGLGGISFLRSHSDWRNSGPTPFPADFKGPEFTGFLFYDQAAGFAAIYDTDGSGKLIELREYPSFGAAWTHITTVRIPDRTTLRLFYTTRLPVTAKFANVLAPETSSTFGPYTNSDGMEATVVGNETDERQARARCARLGHNDHWLRRIPAHAALQLEALWNEDLFRIGARAYLYDRSGGAVFTACAIVGKCGSLGWQVPTA